MVMVMKEMTEIQVHSTSCCDLSDQITIDRRPQADLRLKPTKSPPGWDSLRVTKDPLDPQVKSTNSSLKRLRVSCKNPAEL